MLNYGLFIDPKTGKKLIQKDEHTLVSADNTISYPIINGIPRFVEKELYSDQQNNKSNRDKEKQTGDSFGKKWREKAMSSVGHNIYEKEALQEQFLALLGCESENELKALFKKAKRTLNGGCGTGWSEYLFDLNPLCERHCVDLSLAVESAKYNTKHMENVTISQASILDLPYPNETFDIVYSDGVVHHTPDPRKATQELGRRVRPGGTLGIYIYNKKPFLREMADQKIREHTTKMSFDECLEFSQQMTLLGKSIKKISDNPLVIENDIPHLGIKKGSYDLQKFIYDHIIKCWYNPKATAEYADLVNLDWYHPAYASHHDKDEVLGWFQEIGFSQLKCIQPEGWEHSGYFISGKR
jgi:SAM-dependent methyltransferase